MRRATVPALFGLVLALTFGTPARADGWVSDAWITAKVKIALLTTEGLTTTDVSVDTLDGNVALYGKVPTAPDKDKANAAVKQLDGVKSVKDLLQVVPPEQAAAVEVTDASIRSAVEAALASDSGLSGTKIAVKSVTNGIVLLGGQAVNSAEHLRALETAGRVRGVRRVETNVSTTANDASLDIWSRRELRQDGRGMLDIASDLWLTAETRLRLIADAGVPAPDISVDCRDQAVTLFGAVPSPQAKKAAEDDARSVQGVREVRNELQIVPPTKRAKVEARDAELAQKVTAAIFSRPEMKRASISVDVRNGFARLSGTVPSQQHRVFAASAARDVPGIRAVTENLRVNSITEAAPAEQRNPRSAAPSGG